MSDSLEGRTAVVTGGGSGIGAAIVRMLCARGASVVAVDVDQDALDAVAAATGCTTAVADVGDPGANERVFGSLDGLDLAFLNAGVLGRPIETHQHAYRVADLDLDRYRTVRHVNVDGVVYGTCAAAAAMAHSGGGSIVATASVAGLVGHAPDPFYTATKHAVVGWVRAVSEALSVDGITIDAICPAGVATPLVGLESESAGGRLLHPDEVAAAAITAAGEPESGRAISVVAGRDPVALDHGFAAVDGFG